MSLSIEDIRRIGQCAVDGPIPHDGLREFMEKTNTVKLGEYYVFLHLLTKLLQPDRALDLGTELGRSAFAIASACPSCDVTTIELGGRIPSTWMDYLGQFSNLKIVCGTNTVEWLTNPYNRRHRYGLVHIDTDHSFETTLAEWSLIRPLMEPGSVVCFDDAATDGVGAVLKEIALPKVIFDGTDGPQLHGDNSYAAVLIP